MRLLTRLLILLSLFLLASCGGDNSSSNTPPATSATITSVNPNTVSRGQRNVTVKIQGTNLSGVTGVSMGFEITVHAFRPISATEVDVDFSVATTAASGQRTITVITSGGSASSSTAFSVSSNFAPVAMFKVAPASGNENTEFSFDASESYDTNGSISQYAWNFNDGKPGTTGKLITRKFTTGTYKATLTVTDSEGTSGVKAKDVKVEEFHEVVCTGFARNKGLIYGTVVGVEAGNNAIVKLEPKNSTCANSFYICGDMRDAEVDLGFFGIVSEMADRGDNTFRIKNSCPYHWPPKVGQRIFLFFKSCDENHC